ncbi:UDP-N-acetylglucosamine 1-carboxyvinyltransferase [Candidatus Kaiserbacteria bacterium RIFCSPHIGHO2_12_FULL_56_13]|uniref:UDP-N-acetylglucosamine 1-carboxyvinyltransferase n=1 Tax=Candidatus Kaiserbacteria bacterium RIFCSPHIGHO2_12_FULL_56_13 TaxID=1798505 RepID=A0A1F6EF38_9BACT|nr:MAG: UDP-N-acetylglucosamine 1-carboxyvinyltransferase [Candidatus Kaiserbacteria bacterium RIFCSPHIGHO2_12_FULL_56_13]
MRQEGLNFVVEGGRALKGEVTTSRSKNGAVALLAATLLNRGTTTLEHVPKIEEVNRLIEILRSMGVKVERAGHRVVVTPPEKLDLSHIDREAATKTRSILLFIGSLLHHAHTFDIPQSGGCTLGTRTVRPHLFALEKFGVSIEALTDRYHVEHKGLSPAEIILYESSDTATENTLLVAAKIPGETVIKYASANYQVQELCGLLQKLGVVIEGVGSTTLTVRGIKDIAVDVSYSVAEDPIDSMFFIAAAIATNSALTICRAPLDFLEIELVLLEKMGLTFTITETGYSENGITRLGDIAVRLSKIVAFPERLHPRPYPGLNMDNIPFFAVIAACAEGTTMLHDWVYDKRAIYYTELERLGAQTLLHDPHRISITGPTKWRAAEVICPSVLRIGAMLVVAMLAAKGTSLLRNVYSINRGYEELVPRLTALGASIKEQ